MQVNLMLLLLVQVQRASESSAIAIGKSTQAKSGKSIAVGEGAVADGTATIAIGAGNNATGWGATAVGKNVQVTKRKIYWYWLGFNC